jgi:hypothetical protein
VKKVRSNKRAADKIAKILLAQNEGVSPEVREKRFLALQQIANRVPRAKSEDTHSTLANPAKSHSHV